MSQHVEKDSTINGPTGLAGIKDADDTLAALLAWLKANKLDKMTDVFVTADHGFSTIDKRDATGAERPSGFLAADLARHSIFRSAKAERWAKTQRVPMCLLCRMAAPI